MRKNTCHMGEYHAAQVCTSCPCAHSGTGVWTAQWATLADAYRALDTYSYDHGEIHHVPSGRVYRFERDVSGAMRRYV